MHVQLLSHIQLFVTPWTVVHQAPLSMEFSKQEYLSGLPFPTTRDLPHPEIEPVSPSLAGRFFTTVPPGKSLPKSVPRSKSLNLSETRILKKQMGILSFSQCC